MICRDVSGRRSALEGNVQIEEQDREAQAIVSRFAAARGVRPCLRRESTHGSQIRLTGKIATLASVLTIVAVGGIAASTPATGDALTTARSMKPTSQPSI